MLTCPECQHKNPVGVFFCEACGNPLIAARKPQPQAAAPAPPVSSPDLDMIVCPKCAYHNPPGSLFCAVCKSTLPASEHTPYVGRDELRTQVRGTLDPDPEAQERTRSLRQSRPLIYIQGSTEPTPLSTESDTVFGRRTPNAPEQPTLDLTPYNAHELGVSRLHATITYDNNTFFLRDLNSTNGTSLNGNGLLPGVAYVLNSGDEIRFGKLVCHFYF